MFYRRKHNSHEWFFMSFAKEMNSTFTFATDCGTFYNKDLLHKLFMYMMHNPRCVGVTGRQRVMTYEQQEDAAIKEQNDRRKNDPNVPEPSESTGDWFLRLVQMHDYEASLSCLMGAFTLAGLLPVLPGMLRLVRSVLLNI